MALITCPKCNKKYSDTVASCIHCGNPTLFTPAVEDPSPVPATSEQQAPQTAATEAKPTKTEPVSYLSLPMSYQKELEAEFLCQNEWALKFEQAREAVALFGRSFLLSIPVALVVLFLMFNHPHWINNEQMMQVALYWCLALLIIGIIGTIICYVWYFLALTVGKKSKKWNELYREWLRKEKSIGEEDN